jgi:hypothetical protein
MPLRSALLFAAKLQYYVQWKVKYLLVLVNGGWIRGCEVAEVKGGRVNGM